MSSNSSPAFEQSADLANADLDKIDLHQLDLDHLPNDVQIWQGLKQAIASSSGFQSWQLQNPQNTTLSGLSLDVRVRSYLRETLETLAY